MNLYLLDCQALLALRLKISSVKTFYYEEKTSTDNAYVRGLADVGGIKCQLTVAADGTVSAKALRESDYKHAKRTDKKMK